MNKIYDSPPNRRGTGSIKWDRPPQPGAEVTIPLWIADMDFPSPPPVIEALKQRAEHGVFGYTMVQDSYYQAVHHWFFSRFGLTVAPESVTVTPGIVPAIHSAIRAFSEEGDEIIIQNPVYYPFVSAVTENRRNLLVNNLIETGGRYSMDFEDLEQLASREKAKILILCSPHNPVGRVWSREELEQVADIAHRHSLLVISDEIHCDLIMPDSPRQHIPYSLIGEKASPTVLCNAPSKSFNIPGLATSNIIINDKTLRERFRRELKRSCTDHPNCFGPVAAEAAYLHGAPWLEETLDYIRGSRGLLGDFLSKHLPEISFSPLEA
ncbi:MAG: PatB family C-S lyase, partial [Spirochaetia bacterium]